MTPLWLINAAVTAVVLVFAASIVREQWDSERVRKLDRRGRLKARAWLVAVTALAFELGLAFLWLIWVSRIAGEGL